MLNEQRTLSIDHVTVAGPELTLLQEAFAEVGLITDYDLRRLLEKGVDIRTKSVRSIMNSRPTSVLPTVLAIDAMRLMLERKKPFAVLPVVDGKNKAVGMIHLHDIRKIGL